MHDCFNIFVTAAVWKSFGLECSLLRFLAKAGMFLAKAGMFLAKAKMSGSILQYQSILELNYY
jgi:hypothetical protein